ncbi:GNAT family N-acetyltransferase [Clostridium estertheticum]|uniref:N-acetyltransferase n=1 Tax=Clostridium estertheticum TaxID=238834 RepID=A0AA47EHI4_9CLOT|nr:GNAT family N-acetyltransferase [Clostridium estertheticum]MBU3154937.1 N-acetyltransferase [Clostridium estertheticum]WAG58758.1 N-acetyltransferase [Clostridium estertheticum]
MLDIKKGVKSFYVGDNEEKPLAKMEFVYSGDVITIDHTFVSDELRGQNVARQLLEKIVSLARETNKKIIPICPYAKAELNKNDKYLDVLVDEEK